jgi:hypothetical protein
MTEEPNFPLGRILFALLFFGALAVLGYVGFASSTF